MSLNPPRWTSLNPSRYEWERRAIDFIRKGTVDNPLHLANHPRQARRS